MIIGKIPGYNSKTRGNAGVDYENRLLSNLTIVNFSPIGYSINLMGKANIYKIGPNIIPFSDIQNNKDINTTGGNISSYTALTQWRNMQSGSSIEGESIYDSFKIVSTNDSTITETLSNNYDDNALDKIGSSTFGSAFSKGAQFINGGMSLTSSLDTSAALGILSSLQSYANNELGQAASLLMGKSIGIQSALPKIWNRSSYNNTCSFTIKLIAPSGSPEDVDMFIVRPLKLLLLAASPVTFDGITYGYPPLWKVEAKGMASLKLAGITAISLSRGGPDTVFNRYNQPTNIDVRIVVEPVIQGFATPMLNSINDIADDQGNTKMIVQNPSAITNPMLNNSIRDSSIELKTLRLID